MPKVMVHIHSGPDLKNKATLGLLVAVHAKRNGHDVTVFFAADGVFLLNCKEANKIVGEGTGDVKDHLDELKTSNTKILVSKLSANGRGLGDELLEGYNATFAAPTDLVNCSLESDSVLCY